MPQTHLRLVRNQTPKPKRLVPTKEELQAAKAACTIFNDSEDVREVAKQMALVRLYPEVNAMITRRDTREDGSRGYWPWMDVYVTDEYYKRHRFIHITMTAEEFLALYLAGLIVEDEDGDPQYIGLDVLRGKDANYALPGAVDYGVPRCQDSQLRLSKGDGAPFSLVMCSVLPFERSCGATLPSPSRPV